MSALPAVLGTTAQLHPLSGPTGALLLCLGPWLCYHSASCPLREARGACLHGLGYVHSWHSSSLAAVRNGFFPDGLQPALCEFLVRLALWLASEAVTALPPCASGFLRATGLSARRERTLFLSIPLLMCVIGFYCLIALPGTSSKMSGVAIAVWFPDWWGGSLPIRRESAVRF